jgi:catechol 2,3-dioxygenase-like lactoylglutathione lyase family enzyme
MATPFQVTFDCADPDALARFWAAALGYVVQPPPEGYTDWEAWLTEHGMGDRIGAASAIVDPDGAGARIYFQRVPEPKTAKNRMHLDLNVSEARRVGAEEGRARVEAEAERLAGMGATRGRAFDESGEFWIVMADPEGNEFCVQ